MVADGVAVPVVVVADSDNWPACLGAARGPGLEERALGLYYAIRVSGGEQLMRVEQSVQKTPVLSIDWLVLQPPRQYLSVHFTRARSSRDAWPARWHAAHTAGERAERCDICTSRFVIGGLL